jgi:hypothetical protein
MEASASTHHAPSGVSAPAARQGGHRHMAMLFVGSVLVIYAAIGLAIYALIAAVV